MRQFQEYVEPVEDAPTSRTRAGASNPLHPHPGGGDEKVLLPLGDDTLTHNLGVPIIVVITKVSGHTVAVGDGIFKFTS